MKYGCKGKREILEQLNMMVVHAPNFPPEFKGMDMNMAFAVIEFGLERLERLDGSPAVLVAVHNCRIELNGAKALFESGETIPACHKLQDVEDILRPVRTKPELA
jgi:hypothetical protein